MSRGAWGFYLFFGLTFESLCWFVLMLGVRGDGPGHFKWALTWADIATLKEALDLYKRDVGEFPSSDQGLEAIRMYLVRDVPLDPWGRPYLYRPPEILSLGRDGRAGGRGDDQDISSFRLEEPRLPSAEEVRSRLRWQAATIAAPVCGIGYLFLPWAIRRRAKKAA